MEHVYRQQMDSISQAMMMFTPTDSAMQTVMFPDTARTPQEFKQQIRAKR